MEETKVYILTSQIKKLNKLSNISLCMFTLLWIIIFPLLSFKIEAPKLIAYLMFISFLFAVLAIGGLVGKAFCRNKVLLDRTHCYKLFINSDQIKLEKGKQRVNYSGNFLLALKTQTKYELPAKQAIHLFGLAKEEAWIVEANRTKSNFWEGNPKEIFNDLASILWAAS